MSTVTATLGVNAAFLQEIKDDDREFRQLLCQAVESLKPQNLSHIEPKSIVNLLGELRDRLALHFTLEEAYGYFEDALDAAPQLSQQAEALRGQHQTLFADFCQVVELAEQLLYQDQDQQLCVKIARLFHNFRAGLQLHEAREHELIMAAFNDDLGCGD